MSGLVEVIRGAGSRDAWDKPMVTESEARAIIGEVAGWVENEVDHEDAWWFADLLRAQAKGE